MQKTFYIFIILFFTVLSSLKAQRISKVEYAQRAYDNKNWTEAIIFYSEIVKKNPYKGAYFYKLANSYFNNKDYDKAINYFKKSCEIGFNYGLSIKKIAISYATLKDHKNALIWIRKGLDTPKSLTITDVLSNSVFKEHRKTNEFKNSYSKKVSRKEKWISDIQFLKDRFESKHYNIFDKISSKEWEIEFNALISSINVKNDYEILVDLMKITAKIGDGHTFIRPPFSGQLKLHIYPFKLFVFEEGIFVVQTSKDYDKVLGKQLTHINNIPIEEVVKKVSKTISVDNKIGLLERLDFNLMLSEVLEVLKITNSSQQTLFTFKDQKEKSITLKVDAISFNPATLTEVLKPVNQKSPLYLLQPKRFFWSKYIKGLNAMYIKININLSTPNHNIREFYNEVFDTISKENINHLIIDLRHCPGGNSFNNKSLINNILKNNTIDKENGIFTIIGRRTFSAAMNLSTDLETWTNTKFIGEPTGSKPNFIGETNFIVLPNSKLQVSISDAYWQKSTSWDKRKWIAPDFYVTTSFRDFMLGNDNVLETIKSIINR